MTETATNPIIAQPRGVVDIPTEPTITADIRDRMVLIGNELNDTLKERREVIQGALVALIGQLHMLMLGPGGTGKSLLIRALISHILNSTYFETSLDETTDPSQVFGPPNVKDMVEKGRASRFGEGMLPTATHAMLDELFNANLPLLHSLMPPLNERVWHDNGLVTGVPLRSAFAGTNKLNADADAAAMWDRIHLRYVVGFVEDRAAQMSMVDEALARMLLNGRGTSTSIGGVHTTVDIAELDRAHVEALTLEVPPAVYETFFDIRDELRHGSAGVQISDRRVTESMVAVKANAWLNGHTEVTVGDLDVLASMWWTVQEQAPEARTVILGTTNPGERAAMDLLGELDDLKQTLKNANDDDEMDPARKKRVGIQSVKDAQRLLADANEHLETARAGGTSTLRLEEVVKRTEGFVKEVAQTYFGLGSDSLTGLSK